MSSEDLLDIAGVCSFFGGGRPLGHSTIYRWVREGRIPQPVRIGPKMSRWRVSDCQEALSAMIEASKPGEAQ